MFERLRSRPWLSVIVVFFNMRREASRTLYSLSPAYQAESSGIRYEIIAIDHGSTEPIERPSHWTPSVKLDYRYIETSACSPVAAINDAVEQVDSEYVMINIDGARILSPGVLQGARWASRAFDNPFVYTLGWHLGPDIQNVSMTQGYNQAQEDRLLNTIDWRHDGYRLFEISTLAGSSAGGYFNPIGESNCFTLRKEAWRGLGGFDPRFRSAGGGLVNLDFFQRACSKPDITPVCLLGQGTFHQIHGGVATNVPMQEHPLERFQAEYRELRGTNWRHLESLNPVYLGRLPSAARRFLKL